MTNETNTTPQASGSRIHPLVAGAAVSLIALSLTGIAAMTGWIGSPSAQSLPPKAEATDASAKNAAEAAKAGADASSANTAEARAEGAPARVAAQPRSRGTTGSHAASQGSSYGGRQVAVRCADCAVVESVRAVQKQGEATGLGAVGGGVVGGLLGNQVGKGHGRDAMTVIGAVGGAYAGHQIEKSARSTTQYQTTVRFEDGSVRTFTSAQAVSWQPGDRVRVVNGQLVPRGGEA